MTKYNKKPLYETAVTYLLWSSGFSLVFKDLINHNVLIIYMALSLFLGMYLLSYKFKFIEKEV